MRFTYLFGSVSVRINLPTLDTKEKIETNEMSIISAWACWVGLVWAIRSQNS